MVREKEGRKQTNIQRGINNPPVVGFGAGVAVSDGDGAIVVVGLTIDKDVIVFFVGVAANTDDDFIVSFLGVGVTIDNDAIISFVGVGVTIDVTVPAADDEDVIVCGLRVSAGMSVTSW